MQPHGRVGGKGQWISTSGASIGTSRFTGSGTLAHQYRFRHPCAASRRTTTANWPTTYHPFGASLRTTTSAGTSASATGAAARISARLHLDQVDAAAPSSQTAVGLPGSTPATDPTWHARTSRVVLSTIRCKPRGYAALFQERTRRHWARRMEQPARCILHWGGGQL